jgi:hypothetical protein
MKFSFECGLGLASGAPPLTISNVYAQIPHPQTIFHAFAQQNRMSSPQAHLKPRKPSSINKIKVPVKWFLVIVNPVK